MSKSRRSRLTAFLAIALVALPLLLAAGIKRARPPKWDPAVADTFFPDARQQLVGKRPQFAGAGGVAELNAMSTDADASPAPAAGGSFAWSKLVSAEVLEDEIKRSARGLHDSVDVPSKFKGGGYKVARRQFSLLATLFAVIAEYDGDVRWRRQAVGVRDALARCGLHCKVGTDASFREARERKSDLDELISGADLQTPKDVQPRAKWDEIAGRPPLMQRMEQAQEQGLVVWTADAKEFQKNTENVLHEAQLLALLGEVIQRDGFEFADDETYLGFARQLQAAALDVAEAAKAKDQKRARSATSLIGRACSSCHAGYRR